jgi:hypothetical protein
MKTIPASARLKRWRTIRKRSELRQLDSEMGEMLDLIEKLLRDRKRLVRMQEQHDEMVALVTYHTTEELYKADGSTEPYGNYQTASENLTKLARRLAEKQRT